MDHGHPPRPLPERVTDLERRLGALEARLGAAGLPAPDDAPAKQTQPHANAPAQAASETAIGPTDSAAFSIAQPLSTDRGATEAPGNAPAAPGQAPGLPQRLLDVLPRAASASPAAAQSTPSATPAGPASAATTQPVPTVARSRRSASSWELLIGGKWAAGLGAVAVVIAVAYFVKYAYDEGLFRLLSDTAKCLISASFGVLLLICGEIVLRKVNRWAATGLFSAGVAVLYLTAYASCKYFALVSETWSLALLSLVALVGVGITIRGNLLFVGALSIVAAFVSPLLFPDTDAGPVAFPLYLSAVFAAALALSAYRPSVFRPLRYAGCVGIGVLGALWSLGAGQPWTTVLVFLWLWWGMALAESLLAAARGQSPIGNVVVSLIATSWMILLGTCVITSARNAGFDWTGLYMLGVGLIATALALQFGAGLEGLRGIGDTPLSRFVACLWVQAGALIAAAIAVHFDGYGLPVGWLAIGVAAVELGRRLPSRGVSAYGLLALAVAVLRIFFFDSWANLSLSRAIGTVGVLSVSHWSIVAAFAVIALHFAAFRALRLHTIRIVLAASGTVAWVVLWLFHDTGVLVTGAWLLGATGLALLHRVEARLHYDKQALVLLFLAAAKWLLIDTLLMRAAPDWTPGAAPVLLTAKVLCGIAVAAVLFAAALRIRPPRSAPDPQRSQLPNSTARSLSSICLTASLVALGWLATFEVERLLMLRREVGAAVWPHPAAFVFALTVIWSLVGQLATLVARVLSDAATERAGQVLTFGAAALWLVVGSLAVRASFGAVQVPVLLNGQSIAALVAAATLAALIAQQKQPAQPRFLAAALWSTIGLLGLVTGSLEVDRWATHSLADPDQGRHVGLSIYWALFGIGLVIGGFVRGRHLVRYAGLALLGVTLAKVLLIDTAQIAAAYRIASLLVVGLLLIVTSIAYFKLMPGRGEGGGADRSAGTPSVT